MNQITGTIKLKPHDKVMVFGDSLGFYGFANPAGFMNDVTNELTKLNVTVHNACRLEMSVNDDNLDSIFDLYAEDFTPSVILLMLGQNEATRGVPLKRKRVEKVLIKVLTYASSLSTAPARIILVSPALSGERTDGMNDHDAALEADLSMLFQVAVQYDIEYLDLHFPLAKYLEHNNADNQKAGILTYDGKILNPLGHNCVARSILTYLEAAGQYTADLSPGKQAASLEGWTLDGDIKYRSAVLRRGQMGEILLREAIKEEVEVVAAQ